MKATEGAPAHLAAASWEAAAAGGGGGGSGWRGRAALHILTAREGTLCGYAIGQTVYREAAPRSHTDRQRGGLGCPGIEKSGSKGSLQRWVSGCSPLAGLAECVCVWGGGEGKVIHYRVREIQWYVCVCVCTDVQMYTVCVTLCACVYTSTYDTFNTYSPPPKCSMSLSDP